MIFKRNYFLLDLFDVKSNSMSYSRSMLRCPKLYTRDHPLFMPTYSCRTDSCRPIHALPIRARYDRFMPVPIHAKICSCPIRPIHARAYSCPYRFMPCKIPKKYRWIIHARTYSCQELFMPHMTYSCQYRFMPA